MKNITKQECVRLEVCRLRLEHRLPLSLHPKFSIKEQDPTTAYDGQTIEAHHY
jgi:hypothetical protein